MVAIIFLSIAMMLFSYRFKKYRIRENDHVSVLARLFGSDTSTIFFGCVCLLGVIATIIRVQPAPTVASSERRARVVSERVAMIRYLGQEVARKAPPGAQVLLIDWARAGSEDPVLDATRATLDEVFGSSMRLASVEQFNIRPTRQDHQSIAAALPLTNKRFDEAVKRNPECNVIISLVGVPDDFANSHTVFKVNNKQIMLAVYSENIYHYGALIESETIALCAAPSHFTSYDLHWEPSGDARADFDHHYALITPNNLRKFALENKRMMWRPPELN